MPSVFDPQYTYSLSHAIFSINIHTTHISPMGAVICIQWPTHAAHSTDYSHCSCLWTSR